MDTRSYGSGASYDKRIALLIDADNVSAKYLRPILDELSKYGTVTIKRIYGDWTLSLHAKWKSTLLENSITPIQQFGYTQGKNATDSAMIIDAMDILYANSVEGFCIVSSDSDFTRLAARLRESGLLVIGMGEKKTPVPFRTACDVFVTLELLLGTGRRRGGKSAGAGESGDEGIAEPTASKREIEQAVVDIITDNTNNGKATGLGEIGSRLQKRYPDFDVRSYGTNLLSKLLSEFASVKIAKAGSNVNVELVEGTGVAHEGAVDGANGGSADGAKAEGALAGDGDGTKGTPRAARSKSADAKGAESKGAGEAADGTTGGAAEGAAFADEDGEMRHGRRRRRSRGRRGKSAATNETEAQGPGAAETGAAGAAGAADAEGAEDAAADQAVKGGVTEGPAADVPAQEEKPARRPRRGRGKKNADAAPSVPVEDAPADAEEDVLASEEVDGAADQVATEKKPGRARRRPSRAKAAADAPASQGVEAAAAETQAAAAETQMDDRDVVQVAQAFLLETIAARGVEGAAIGELSALVRRTYKDFRVTKTGYRNLRLYVASLPGVTIEKREDDNYAVMA